MSLLTIKEEKGGCVILVRNGREKDRLMRKEGGK